VWEYYLPSGFVVRSSDQLSLVVKEFLNPCGMSRELGTERWDLLTSSKQTAALYPTLTRVELRVGFRQGWEGASSYLRKRSRFGKLHVNYFVSGLDPRREGMAKSKGIGGEIRHYLINTNCVTM